MLGFLSENWSQILLIIVGASALVIYLLQESRKRIDAASLIIMQIDELRDRLSEISTYIVDSVLNSTAFYESLPLMEENYWNKYKHYFVGDMDATSYAAINKLYDYASEVQEQQSLMKTLQKKHFELTQKALISIESQFVLNAINNRGTDILTQNVVPVMESLIPANISENDRATLQAMIRQMSTQNPHYDIGLFWNTFNQQKGKLIDIINNDALTFYTPKQISVSLEKILNAYSMLSVVGTDGYQILKRISKRKA